MKHIILLISIISATINLHSQDNIENILAEIESNNTMLSALRSSVEAQKLGNKTGNYLQNPEVEFHYLWSNPNTLGNRTDISIKQSFDFPSAYAYGKQISDIKNKQADLEYKKQLRELMLKAHVVCLDLIYTNSLKVEYATRLEHAKSVADSYSSKYDIGDCNILEYNKAQLNLFNISNELETIEIERVGLLAELAGLNGGKLIDFDVEEFPWIQLPQNFEQWYIVAESNNPLLAWLRQEIELSHKQIKYSKAMSLPKIDAGYMSERIVGEQFQGIVVGLSIPLWENKNTVKYVRGNAIAFESISEDQKQQYFNHLNMLHSKAVGLQKSTDVFRNNLISFNSSNLLNKAMENGQFSLIEYIYELSTYYESKDKLLELELELHKTAAELNQFK
ncbi:MAG: TolC family protein [Bacteroidetes bacterium]|nr:TolC family protein [Bacteroidota bacterium]